jgi:hypothetical protein
MARSIPKSLALYLTSLYNTDFKALECNFEMNLGKIVRRIGRKEKYKPVEGWNFLRGKWAWNTQFDISIDCHVSGNVLYRAVNQSLSYGTGYCNCLM